MLSGAARNHDVGIAASLQNVAGAVIAIDADPGRRGIPDSTLCAGWRRGFGNVPVPHDEPYPIATRWKCDAARPDISGLRAVAGLEIWKRFARALPPLKHWFDEAKTPRHFLPPFFEISTGRKAGYAVLRPLAVSGLLKVEGGGRDWIGGDDYSAV